MIGDGDVSAAPDEELPIAEAPQRVSGMRVPPGWALPGRPEGLSADAEDAWRQSGFLLGEDLRLLAAGLDVQARLVGTGQQPQARTMTMAAHATLWSRALSSSSDAATLVRRGAYQSALPLVRQAVEHVAAQMQLDGELDEFSGWAHRAFARHPATRAEEVGLGHDFGGEYFGSEAIAGDEQLRLIYRAASDFGRPNFGPSALLVARGASHDRYPLVFADQAFHLGWAQLLLGWLLRTDERQLLLALHAGERFPAPPELHDEVVEHVRAVDSHLADERRCRVEEHEDETGRRRHLLLEFRARPGDASKRVLL